MDLDNIQRKYGLPAPLPVVQNGKFAPRFPLNLEHRGDDVFQFGGKYIGEIENIYDLLYKILTNQEIDASLALPYAIKITEDKLYVRDKTNSEWILIFDITKPNFPKEIELYELIYKAITHQVIGEDTSYPGQFKIEENILYVRDKDNLTWTQIGDVTKEFLGATEATQAILDQVSEILTEVQELKTELNRQIVTTNETLTTALQAANEAMINAQSINIRTFNSVEEMKASNTLKAGALAKTQGFYTAGDGGGADYLIINDLGEDEVDKASIITLQNSLYAKLLVQDYVNIKWFGAKFDGITDDSVAFNKATTFIQNNTKEIELTKEYETYTLYMPKGILKINNPITIDVSCMKVIGESTVIDATDTSLETCILLTSKYVEGTTRCPFTQHTRYMEGIVIIGHNESGSKLVAIRGDDSTDDKNVSRFGIKNCSILKCLAGVKISKNAYVPVYENVYFGECYYGYYVPDEVENSGERISFINCAFDNNFVGVYGGNNATNFFFTSCSIDYQKMHAIQLRNGAGAYFDNCHFEWDISEENSHFVLENESCTLAINNSFLLGMSHDYGNEVFNENNVAEISMIENNATKSGGVKITNTKLSKIFYKYFISGGQYNFSNLLLEENTFIPYLCTPTSSNLPSKMPAEWELSSNLSYVKEGNAVTIKKIAESNNVYFDILQKFNNIHLPFYIKIKANTTVKNFRLLLSAGLKTNTGNGAYYTEALGIKEINLTEQLNSNIANYIEIKDVFKGDNIKKNYGNFSDFYVAAIFDFSSSDVNSSVTIEKIYLGEDYAH